jgi:hypothetical protein
VVGGDLLNFKRIFLILIIIALVCGCTQHTQNAGKNVSNNATIKNSSVANLLPEKLMGMHKLVALKGENALSFVKKSHRGPIKYVKDIALVHYIGNSSMMIVWLTEYPSAKIAGNQTLLMVKGMEKYGSVWSHVNKTKLGNLSVYYVPGKNQYFFYKDKYVVYLIPVNMSGAEIMHFAKEIYDRLP